YFSVRYAWVSADAPYFLSVGRDISEGKILYKDVIHQYTPLVSIIFGFVYSFLDHPSFNIFVTLQLLATALNSILLFRLFTLLSVDWLKAAVVSSAFYLAVLSCDGNYIVLETYSIFFVLLALVQLVKDKGYFIAGILLGF